MAAKDRQAREREQAFAALGLMRRERLSLNEAAGQMGVSPGAVRRHVGEALQRSPAGVYRAKPFDRIPRPLNFISAEGIIPIEVHDSRDATLVSEHATAVKKYLATGDTSLLAPFRGKRLATYRFVTDPGTLDALADAGELEYDTIYNYVFGART